MSEEQQINLTQLLDTFQLLDTNKDGSISSNEVYFSLINMITTLCFFSL
jgi:Ca2+-binding EF-hand superfamily protein